MGVLLPALVGPLCLGIGSGYGLGDLGPADTLRLASMADSIHARDGYRTPISPLRLAAVAGVRLYRLPSGQHHEMVGSDGTGWFPSVKDEEEQGLWIAHVLAGLLLRRLSDVHREPHTWTLAALLLAPVWAVERLRPGAAVPATPRWLLTLRRRFGGGEGRETGAAMRQIARSDIAST